MDEVNLQTYNDIAKEFSETRAYIWQCVKDFTKSIHQPSKILEIGAGNGKNMEHIQNNTSCEIQGVDYCENFVNICKTKNLQCTNADSKHLPFVKNSFDYVMCIAMFHHLLTEEDQTQSMNEILRVLKPKGKGIITCWSTEQPPNSKFTFVAGVNVVPWKGRKGIHKTRYYYVYSKQMFQQYFESFQEIEILDIYNEQGNWILLFTKRKECVTALANDRMP